MSCEITYQTHAENAALFRYNVSHFQSLCHFINLRQKSMFYFTLISKYRLVIAALSYCHCTAVGFVWQKIMAGDVLDQPLLQVLVSCQSLIHLIDYHRGKCDSHFQLVLINLIAVLFEVWGIRIPMVISGSAGYGQHLVSTVTCSEKSLQ